MGQHGGTGHRPVLATSFGLLLFFTLTFLLQTFELRNSPQTIIVYFISLSTSLTPLVGTNTCSPKPFAPAQVVRPFRVPPEAQPLVQLDTNPPFTQLYVFRLLTLDPMLGFYAWPILWKRLRDQLFKTGSHVPFSIPGELLSSPIASEPILAYPGHHLAFWAPSPQFLVASHGQVLNGHTALNPLSSSRNETSAILTPNGAAFNLLLHSHASSNSEPVEITWLHFASCIYNPNSLAQLATPLSTTGKGEIGHEIWEIYFLPKFLQFIPFPQTYSPFQGVTPSSQPKHSNVLAKKTAILAGQSEARDPFYFSDRHWLRQIVRFRHEQTMATLSSLATAVAAASPVPIPRETSNGPDIMLDSALPNLLLDSANLSAFTKAFPGHDFASLVRTTEKLRDFQIPLWPIPLPSIQNEIVSRFRQAEPADLPGVLIAMTQLASDQLEKSKVLAQSVADTMNICSDLTHEGQSTLTAVEALLARLTEEDAVSDEGAFPYRLALQQMQTHLPTHIAHVSALGKQANDVHLTFTRHLLIHSHRVTYLSSELVKDRVAQGRTPRILGLSNEAYGLDHLEWHTASSQTIASTRADGPQRQRRQEPFASMPPLEQAYPLHCDSVHISLQGVDPYFPGAPQTEFDSEPVRLTLYAWNIQCTDDEILEGIRLLNNTRWELTNTTTCRTQKASNIRWMRLTSASMHDQLWECLLRRVICLPNNIRVAIKAVIPDTQQGTTPLYHTWGVINPDYNGELTPLKFPLAVEDSLVQQGIRLLMNPQRLRGEWLDTICASGTPDLVFRSTTDLIAYQALPPQLKPFLVSKVSGQRANLSGKEVVLSKPMGPYRLTLYNLCFTTQASIQSLLDSDNLLTDGYEVKGSGPRQTHLIGFSSDDLRFRACQFLAYQTFPGINQSNPLQVSLDVGCPTRHCFHCYHPDNPSLSRGHTSSDCPNAGGMCTICHLLDHLTSACSWSKRSAFKPPPPRSTIPVQDRIGRTPQPRHERNRAGKRDSRTPNPETNKRGRRHPGHLGRVPAAHFAHPPQPPQPHQAAAPATPPKSRVLRSKQADGSITLSLQK